MKDYLTIKNITAFIAIISSIIALSGKIISLYSKVDELKEDKTELKEHYNEQIVKRNTIINQYYDEFNQLIEEKEDCKTTHTIIKQNLHEEIKQDSESIEELQYLADSFYTLLESRHEAHERMSKLSTQLINEVPKLNVIQPNSKVVLINTKPLKTIKNKPKKRRIKNIIDKLNIFN